MWTERKENDPFESNIYWSPIDKKTSTAAGRLRTMHLRRLQYFTAVADELHFGRAARRLHIAQPALTQQIRQLEKEIGTELFHRTTRRVELTPAGTAYLHHARRALTELEHGASAATRAVAGETGRLSLGFAGSTTYELLPRLVRSFRSQYPSVRLEIHNELLTSAQIAALADHTIDVGFLRPPVPGADLGLEHVRDESLIAALPEGHRLAGRRNLDLALLADEGFVLYPHGASTSLGIISACNAAGFSPIVTQEASETHTLVCLVAAGLGVSLLPESVRYLKIPGVVYVSLNTAPPPLELWMAWREDETASPALHNFLTMARTVFAQD